MVSSRQGKATGDKREGLDRLISQRRTDTFTQQLKIGRLAWAITPQRAGAQRRVFASSQDSLICDQCVNVCVSVTHVNPPLRNNKEAYN